MCVVRAEVFYNNPQEYLWRAKTETVIIMTDEGGFSLQSKIPNAETLKAMEECEQILEDVRAGKRKGYDTVETLFEDLNADD